MNGESSNAMLLPVYYDVIKNFVQNILLIFRIILNFVSSKFHWEAGLY